MSEEDRMGRHPEGGAADTEPVEEPRTGAADAGAEAPRKTVAATLGEIVWLLSQSPVHRHSLFCADIEWLVMPPLLAGQYRLFYADQRPVGAALWAYVTEAAEQRLAGGGRIGAGEWRAGDRLWLVELIAPFGQQETMLEDLRHSALAQRRFRFLRTHANGRRETVELTGERAGQG